MPKLTARIDGIPAAKITFPATSSLGEITFHEYDMDGVFFQITSRDPLAQWRDGKVVSRDPLAPRLTARLIAPSSHSIDHLIAAFSGACLWHGFTNRNPTDPRAFLTKTRGWGVLHATKEL